MQPHVQKSMQNFINACSLVYEHRNPHDAVEHADFWARKPLKWISGDGARNYPMSVWVPLMWVKHWSRERMGAVRVPTTEKYVHLLIRKENKQRRQERWVKKSEEDQERMVPQRLREKKCQDQVIQTQTSA